MSRDKSNSCGPERDFLCKGPSACLLWGAPWVAFALGFRAPPGLRTVLWATSLAVMGVACLLNASRCGRVHCRFTGPFFIVGALTSLGYGVGLLPLGRFGWSWIGLRNNHRSNRPHLDSRIISRSISTGRVQRRPNQPMKPTAPLRYNFSEIATTPCRGLSLSR
jgi:hypothetical protein